MIWGLNGVLYAQSIADVIAAIITAFMSIRLHKELASVKSYSVSTARAL